jgi:hypothetical protein
VVRAVSDAARKAVPAGVAEQALPEPYVPGSGDRVPAELRLVLPGYVGIAGGLFATALACAAAAVFLFFFVDVDLDDDTYWLLFFSAVWACIPGAVAGALALIEAWRVFEAASAAQRSTHGHGDGLEARWTHAVTRHSVGRHRPR